MHSVTSRSVLSYVFAVAATALVACVRLTVSDTAGNFAPLIPFVGAVVVSAWYGGLWPGLLATSLSTLAADYLLVPGQHSLRTHTLTGAVALGAFFVTGVLISFACESLHRSRRLVEQEQEKLRLSLEAQRAMQEALAASDRRKNEFLATLAHELRNPLAPMRNAAYVLRDEAIPSRKQQWARDVIDRQVTQMARLVDDLMDVARITRGALELRRACVDIRDVIHDAIETSRPVLEARHHQLSVTLPPSPVHVHADRVRLSQVFSNLLNNAAKYTNPGGHIQVRAGSDVDGLVVHIIDNGVGIPPQKLEWIFEPFAQLESSQQRSQGGLGIGLALASRLVQMHGGKLVAQSEGIGKGSQFTVHLREMSVPSEIAAADSGCLPQARDSLRARVLVVDDNHDCAESLSLLLEQHGYQTRTAGDGAKALQTFHEFQPNVALLDIGLPQLDGYELARRIRAQRRGEVILIAVTGWGGIEHRRQAEAAGFDHHFVKPVDLDRLRQLLEALPEAISHS